MATKAALLSKSGTRHTSFKNFPDWPRSKVIFSIEQWFISRNGKAPSRVLFLRFAGIVRFHEVSVSETEREGEGEDTRGGEEMLTVTSSLLEHYVQSVRDSLGVQSQ